MAVGVESFLFGRLIARRGQTGLFRSLDLSDAAIVDDELHDAKAEAFDFFADERDPVRV